jgi:hypothetical protein
MNPEHREMDELIHAISDTGLAVEAAGLLREQLNALGYHPSVPAELWHDAVKAQRATETCHLAIFEHIRQQASEAIK